jgi:hypothetical protein
MLPIKDIRMYYFASVLLNIEHMDKVSDKNYRVNKLYIIFIYLTLFSYECLENMNFML